MLEVPKHITMCFHNSMSKKAKQLAIRYGRQLNIVEIAEKIIQEQYHVSAFKNPEYPIITIDPNIQIFNWELIPFWVKSREEADTIRTKTYNARSETIFQKPSFRSSIINQRCIVPSTGFFDWRHEKGKKIPYFIYMKNEDIFSMAGIYSIWEDPDNYQKISSFSIITTTANELMSCIHNTNFRMPVLLHKDEEEKWLSPQLKRHEIINLLHPLDNGLLDAYIISNDFLKKAPNDSSIILPLNS